MEKHSTVVGGSTAARVLGCPGSVRLTAKAPPEGESSEYANEGTALHEIMAELVTAGSRDTERYRGKVLHGTTIGDYHIELLDKTLNAVRTLTDPTTNKVMVETHVALTPVPDAYGTADLVLVRDDSVVVLDYKFGSGVMVGIEGNKQLMFYAAALFFTHPALFLDDAGKPKNIWIAILQPTDRDGDILKFEALEIDDLVAFTRQLVRALSRDDINLGDHCRWCPAITICPKMKEAAERSLALTPDDMEPDALRDALAMASRLDSWITQLRSYAHQFASRGHAIPDYKLVPKRAVRHYKDEDVAAEQLVTLGLPTEDLWKKTLISPAQAEKALKTKLPEGLIRARSSGTVLVPESDSRKPVVGGPALLQALSDNLTALTSK